VFLILSQHSVLLVEHTIDFCNLSDNYEFEVLLTPFASKVCLASGYWNGADAECVGKIWY
jgi:hypothetical protein